MKRFHFCLFLVCFNSSFAQDIIDWSPDYQIKLEDFQAKATSIDSNNVSFAIYPSTRMNFSFAMSSYEFMLTKNFNSKVSAIFTRSSSILRAPNKEFAESLLNYAQLSFDMTELYARKYRKNLYESKKTLSNYNFFEKSFESIEKEYSEKMLELNILTNEGQSEVRIAELRKQTLLEIETLSDFCKNCKPKKKK